MTLSVRPLVPLAAAAALLVPAVPALAKHGKDNRVSRSGTCSAGSHWKLKAKPDDTGTEVEFEVDQNRTGVKWTVTLSRNGSRLLKATRTTKAPSGSFSLSRHLGGGTGDRFSARATRPGETCQGSVSL